ncbi:hypothetical protein [Tsukamurella soli]|uniref:Uncharacterized protein n=1 Tax=Tsukamurella soli TaxID=644556 RepID=A0ABP8JZP8_9ACTN
MGLRDVYDAVERAVTPRVEAAVRSDELAEASKAVVKVRRAIGSRIDGVNAGLLHLVNIPAASDIRRLRRQLGEMDFELRQLRMELAARDAERRRDDDRRRLTEGDDGARDS